MTKADKKRQMLIWGALLATLAATAWVAASEDEGRDAVSAIKPARSSAPTTALVNVSATPVLAYQPRAIIESEPQDLFPGGAPPEEKTAPAPPPKPTTPPLPFGYAGKLAEDGNFIVFLTHGTRNLAVHVGDVIDGVWRIESIRPPTMVVGYLPLKTEVPIAIGETN